MHHFTPLSRAIDHCRHGLTPSAEPLVDIVECSRIDIVDRRIRGTGLLWTDAVRQKHRSFREKENLYWSSKIAQDGDNPTKLWRSLSSVMRKNTNSSSQSVQSTITAENFLKFFHDKVAAVRASTDGNETLTSSTPASSSLTDFASFTSEELRRIIMNSPSKSCSLDPIPTFILKEVIDIVLPFLTVMCNASLQEGLLPVSQRHAIITPLLKKQSLDPTELKNYRPVSNLTFMSKIVEKLVSERLTCYLQANNLMPRLQSAYRRHHSTETALLRVVSDILRAVDSGKVALLSLLDLSAAFDTVDHSILLDRLHVAFGIGGAALGWIRTFSDCSNTAGTLSRISIQRRSTGIWCPSRIGPRTTFIRPVYGRSV